MVNCGAIANAAVLKNCAVVCCDEGRLGFDETFGRCVPKPAKALKFVTCVTAKGSPDCNVPTPASSNPAKILLVQPLVANRFPLPKGSSYVMLVTKTFGISPFETSRSSFRLKLSATGKFAIGPVRIEASNTVEASSMSLDLV